MADDLIFGVYQLNEYVRRLLAGDSVLQRVQLRGELSGFKRHVSGHLYFSLKDEQARVNCVMFKQHASGLTFEPKDGMRVILAGSVSLFVRDGAYQVYGESMRKEGIGDLYLRFEQLKAKLAAEGLFDPAIKKPIPMLPRRIGVITSRTGAVLRDIVRVARRRNPHIGIQLVSAAVQGEGAPREIAAAIDLLNAVGSVDVILCGRGGGSLEDLWAFNEEIVARAIARSQIPIVSCVGHETDFTIADFAADLRAPTPSAAAELTVPVFNELSDGIDDLALRMPRAIFGMVALRRARLERLLASPALAMPRRMIVERNEAALGAVVDGLTRGMEHQLEKRGHAFAVCERALSGLNPSSVIDRGYAVIRVDDHAIPDAAALSDCQAVTIQMRDGTVGASIKKRGNI